MPWPISRADLQQVTTTVREIVQAIDQVVA
jgi:hypothetical protein